MSTMLSALAVAMPVVLCLLLTRIETVFLVKNDTERALQHF
jgi:hypothetical protein